MVSWYDDMQECIRSYCLDLTTVTDYTFLPDASKRSWKSQSDSKSLVNAFISRKKATGCIYIPLVPSYRHFYCNIRIKTPVMLKGFYLSEAEAASEESAVT